MGRMVALMFCQLSPDQAPHLDSTAIMTEQQVDTKFPGT